MARARRIPLVFLSAVVVATICSAAACRRDSPPVPRQTESIPDPGQLPADAKKVIVFLGDSVTVGYGLTLTQAFPLRIQDMFHAEGYNEIEVLNAGATGDTTAGALRRVEQLIEPNVKILVVALGGNDALRGLSTTQTRENVKAIIEGAQARGVAVMLAGMEAPPNLGEDYQAAFRAAFAQLARDYRGSISYMPFLLEGVAGNPSLNQADGIHPNEQGARIIADHLYPRLRDMVDQLPQPGAG
ncbi:MAG: arylesterase [Vicinamibacterales bacterium]